MKDLDKIISEGSLKIKRALAIKMILSNFSIEEICDLLSVKKSFIEKWRAIYNREGAKDLDTKHKGSTGFLTESQLEAVCSFIRNKDTCLLRELIDYIKDNYGFSYKSKQSYYDILTKAGMSWKKTENINPKKDEELVANKKEEIKKNFKNVKMRYLPGIWSY